MFAEDAGDSNRKVLAGQWPAKGRAQRGPRALPQGDAGIPPPPPSCTTDASHRGVFHVAAPVNWSVGLDGTSPRCVRRSGPVPTQCRLVRRIGRNEPPFRLPERTSGATGDSRAEAVGNIRAGGVHLVDGMFQNGINASICIARICMPAVRYPRTKHGV
jgi:hypothetical protein